MGYACPVCDDPQADEGHLANHLAMTAVLRGGEHEAWLDEHVEGWAEMGEADLGPLVAELAEETEYPQVFEDTTGSGGEATGHEHGTASDADRDGTHGERGELPPGAADLPDGFLATDEGDDEGHSADEILARARELTEQRRADESETE